MSTYYLRKKKHIMSLNNNKIDAKKSIIHLGETLIEGNLLDFIKGILKKKKKSSANLHSS